MTEATDLQNRMRRFQSVSKNSKGVINGKKS
jgi:hypothetical protein